MITTLNKIRACSPCASGWTKLCECGCGEFAPLAKRTSPGVTKGSPLRFVSGHNSKSRQTVDFFMQKVQISETGCWNWIGVKNKKGYGITQLHSVRHYAHKTMFLLHGNSVPNGMHLDHLCRNTGCVNPIHLDVVTPAENNRRKNHAARDVQADLLRIVCVEIELRDEQ